MVRSMMHQAGCAAGVLADPEAGVYAGWVAHPESFAAGQPFRNAAGDITLLFSGECFPDPDDIRRLKAGGTLTGDRPGSWLVPLYEEQGIAFVRSLNGLFSGLLIDARRRCVFLFNDRYGVERLYVSETRDGLWFASEAKAILSVRPETRSLDPEAVADRITWGCNPSGPTLFRGIALLPGGSLWTIGAESVRRDQFFRPAEWEALPALAESEYREALAEALNAIVPVYFDAPRPPGISLTGGLDTRMVMAFRPREAPACPTYTFAGPGRPTLDVTLARRVAATAGFPHHVLRLDEDFFRDFGTLADRTVHVTDGTCGITGTHEIHLHRLARSLSDIRLTGNFGSEILRSMSTFRRQEPDAALFQAELCELAAGRRDHPAGRTGNPVTFAAFQEIPWNLFGTLAAGRSELTFRTPFLDNRLVALAYQAPRAARRSPRPVLQAISFRDPALSRIASDRGLAGDGTGAVNCVRHLLAELSFRIEYRTNEGLHPRLSRFDGLIQAAANATGLNGLHKFLHYRRWFRTRLAGWLRDRLEAAAASQTGIWKPDAVRRLAGEHISGRTNHLPALQTVLTFEAIDRLLIRGHAEPAVHPGPLPDPKSNRACILLS